MECKHDEKWKDTIWHLSQNDQKNILDYSFNVTSNINHIYVTLEKEQNMEPINFQIGSIWFNRIVQKGNQDEYIGTSRVSSNQITLSEKSAGITGRLNLNWHLISAKSDIFDNFSTNKTFYVFPQIEDMFINSVHKSIFPNYSR